MRMMMFVEKQTTLRMRGGTPQAMNQSTMKLILFQITKGINYRAVNVFLNEKSSFNETDHDNEENYENEGEIHDFKLNDEEEAFGRSQEDRRQEMYRNYGMLHYGNSYQAGNNQCKHSGDGDLDNGGVDTHIHAGRRLRQRKSSDRARETLNKSQSQTQRTVVVWTPTTMLARVRPIPGIHTDTETNIRYQYNGISMSKHIGIGMKM